MDAKTHGKMTRGKLQPEARIDLHGMTLAEAHPELIRFILNAHSPGLRLVLVITGKGKRRDDTARSRSASGALRHQVPLAAPAPLGPAVLQVSEAHLKHGGAGAYYVYLFLSHCERSTRCREVTRRGHFGRPRTPFPYPRFHRSN
jgi:DNA-nicking Smr family endonuclease